jgi:uncharacterized protein YecE (DUF72 family)
MILYGLAGWSYDDWAGRVYPKTKPRGFHPLAYLARYIDLMEINSSFYALPNPRYAARWASLVEPFPDFRFTAKLHQSFTHGPLKDFAPDAAEAYRLGIKPLADAGRLLTILGQFPVTFRADDAGWARLTRIRELLPAMPMTLELRHRSWFHDRHYARLEALAYGLAHIDLPAARDHPPAAHPSLGPLAYLRIHGRNASTWFDAKAGRDERYDYRYDAREVEGLAERLQTLAGRSEKALLVANNHFGGQAVANALEIKAAVSGSRPRAPAPLVATYPELRLLTTPDAPEGDDAQLGLF